MRRLFALLLLAAVTGCGATTGTSLALAVELDATTLTRAAVTVSGPPGATTVTVRTLGTQIRQAERADGERGACVISPDGATATCAVTLTTAGPVGIDVRLAPVCVPIAVTASAPGADAASVLGGIAADRCMAEPVQAADASAPIGVRWTPAGAVATFAGPGCLALDGGWGGPRPIPGACADGPGWVDIDLSTALVKEPTPGDAYLLIRGEAVVGRAALGDRHTLALPLIGR